MSDSNQGNATAASRGSTPVVPPRFDEFADLANQANVARLAYESALADQRVAEAATISARVRYAQIAGALEIRRREIFEHEAVAA